MISVVIPVYNREKTICRCIDSVFNQTYDDLEVIVVDDCSTDRTCELILEYKDPRLRLVRLKRNSGAASARNRGTSLASGDYVSYQDSDDCWYPDKLEKQLNYLIEQNADICLCRLKRFGYGVHDDPVVPSQSVQAGDIDYVQVLKGSMFAMPSVLVTSELAKLTPFDESLLWHEDFEWSVRLSKGRKVVLLDNILGEVYLQDNSVSLRNLEHESDFYSQMLVKHQAIFDEYPWFKSLLLTARGNCRILNGENGCLDFADAFKASPSAKGLLRMALSHTPLLKTILRLAHEEDSIK